MTSKLRFTCSGASLAKTVNLINYGIKKFPKIKRNFQVSQY